MRMRPAVLATAAVLLLVLASAQPGWAVVTGPCDGSVTIDGVTYGPANDTVEDPIVVPADTSGVVAAWVATTGSPITNHSGFVGMVVGPMSIELDDWQGANADQETRAEGDYSLDSLPDFVQNLTGIYEVTAHHAGDGGTCDGSVMVKLEGNAATTPVGAGSIGGALLAGIGLVAAGRGRAA